MQAEFSGFRLELPIRTSNHM